MGRITLLDGGFSTQLSKHVGEIIDGDPLWSARFLKTDRQSCILAHRDFIKAGAKIITTGSYQASIDGFKSHLNLGEEEAIKLIKESVDLAKEAITLEEEESGVKKNILVAGSVGPYGATLHDGSEYTGNYSQTMTREGLKKWHKPRFEALVERGVDLIAFETIPCSLEAYALLDLLKENTNVQAWLSFSIKDGDSISNGESFKEVAETCWRKGENQLVAIGVNCVDPVLVTPVLQKLHSSFPSIPLIAYPNSGERYDAQEGLWHSNSDTKSNLKEFLNEWFTLGVTYLGGCCRTSDNEIRQFSEEIKIWESKNN